MKAALAGSQFPGQEDLLTGIQEFLSEIQRPELELVFHHWIERVQWVLDNNGDYFHEQTFSNYHSFQFCPDRPVGTIHRSPDVGAELWKCVCSLACSADSDGHPPTIA
jgi:hypothetical protein